MPYRFLLFLLCLLGMSSQATDWPQLTLVPIAQEFDRSVYLTHVGGGSQRLFVVEQIGQIHILSDNQSVKSPFLDIAARRWFFVYWYG